MIMTGVSCDSQPFCKSWAIVMHIHLWMCCIVTQKCMYADANIQFIICQHWSPNGDKCDWGLVTTITVFH